MFYLSGCPMHLGVGNKGLIHSLNYLRDHYSNLNMHVIPEKIMPEENLPNLKYLNSVVATCEEIAQQQYQIMKQGRTPLFIGGDHSSVMGSISASSSYLHHSSGNDLGLIWIDAHPDINTDATTITGNIHGMPVAALLGMGAAPLTGFLDKRPKLKPENIVMLGLRDIDPPEAVFLKKQKIKYFTYDDICKKGLTNCLEETIRHLSDVKGVHISFDIDSMDPLIMPGVSVPVSGGLKETDVFEIFTECKEHLPVIAYDIVEYNREYDRDDVTADFVSELVDFIKNG